MAYQWVDVDRGLLSRRYDKLAGFIPFFEWLLFLPPGLRRRAAERLELRRGERVLEVGCGTGRNFPYLAEAVGPHGRIYGVDLSPGMLRRAQELRDRCGWARRIELIEADAADYRAPEPLDGVLFSLSYNTMPHHLTVLHHVWEQLRPGGRLVIMDAKPPPGLGGRLALPFGVWLMKHTLLGNPFVQPWRDLNTFPCEFEMSEYLFGSYFICRGRKPWSETVIESAEGHSQPANAALAATA